MDRRQRDPSLAAWMRVCIGLGGGGKRGGLRILGGAPESGDKKSQRRGERGTRRQTDR